MPNQIYKISYVRAVLVFGILGYGSFMTLGFGAFFYYIEGHFSNLGEALLAYLFPSWFLGGVIGFVNRKHWGLYESKNPKS